jgi:hypothetical protein
MKSMVMTGRSQSISDSGQEPGNAKHQEAPREKEKIKKHDLTLLFVGPQRSGAPHKDAHTKTGWRVMFA